VAGDGTGGPALTDIFVRDRQTNTTTRVSVDTAGGDPNGPSFLFLSPTISDDGRYVAFSSNATDLVPADGNSDTDVFVRDLQTHTTTRVSVDRTGGDAETASDLARISASGRYVAFESKARDLVPGDGNCTAEPEGLVCRFDVYVRDLQTGVTTRVSVDTGGDDPNADSQHGAVSADGRYVVFESRASDLVSNDTNGLIDIFLWDRNTGTIQRMNTNANGAQAVGGQSIWPWITPDGGHVTFTSGATNLVSNDGNGFDDVFVRNL
jgi:Tol biopolymer transport system component